MPEPVVSTNRKIMNISPTMQAIGLDTQDEFGRRESVILRPRDVREVTVAQFQSRELQKLLGSKFLVDVTSAGERRAQREKEFSQSRGIKKG